MNVIEHGDTWTIRDGQQVIIASHRWPPPLPGTHESQLEALCPCYGGDGRFRSVIEGQSSFEHNAEAIDASRWSRAHATKEGQ